MRTDLLLDGATVITMDPARRVLTDTSILVSQGRIKAVAPASELRSRRADSQVVDCHLKIVLPGLVDLHGYLGGSLLKSLGVDLDGATQRDVQERILTREIDEEWWAVETELSAVERLKVGTTCMFSMLGGNGDRSDDPVFARTSAKLLNQIGLRTMIGLGPARPPWPREYGYWRNGKQTLRSVSFEQVIDVCDGLLSEQAGAPGIVRYWTQLSRIGNKNEHDPVWSPDKEVWIRRQADAIGYLTKKHNVGFWTHMYGNAVEYAHDERLNLLGRKTVLSHCTGITKRAIDILRETGTHVGHHPRAARMYSYPGRCPVPELIDAGVNVGLGADSPLAHDCDMFLDMKAAIRAQRMHFKDARMMPPGKALEMATIDGYKALGLDGELGSVEVGKRADLITIDLDQPHLRPIDMPVYRVVYQATGKDVTDIIVDGRVVMLDRIMKTIDERNVLDRAQETYDRMIDRCNLRAYTEPPKGFWSASRTRT